MPKTKMHEFKQDPQSGAGNCVCGHAERHEYHFHKFVKAQDSENCTCGFKEGDTIHIEMVWVNDEQVMAKGVYQVMKGMNEAANKERERLATYDIVVVVDEGILRGTHMYLKRTSETLRQVMDAMDNDRVFGLIDENMVTTMFRPNEISKMQFNLVGSWSR